MNWIDDISKTINYIESHLEEDIDIETIASKVSISPFYFQKAFSIMCGVNIGEYIRNRRLSNAGVDILNGMKIIDCAIKYCYDSSDSFTKAFTRFHGVTPSSVKNGQVNLRLYEPLKLSIIMKGGFDMNCKIVKKESFKLIGKSILIKCGEGTSKCPLFWDEFYKEGNGKFVAGMYGVCIDSGEDVKEGYFKYAIADDLIDNKEYPKEFEEITIKENTWAIFKCIGPMPSAMQEVYEKIFKEWLPNNSDYEMSGEYNIEAYSDLRKYKLGNQDPNYESEIWIPIKQKTAK